MKPTTLSVLRAIATIVHSLGRDVGYAIQPMTVFKLVS